MINAAGLMDMTPAALVFWGAPGPVELGEPVLEGVKRAEPVAFPLPVGRRMVELPEAMVVVRVVDSAAEDDAESVVVATVVVEDAALLEIAEEVAVLPEMVNGPR
jgi:hypothetical protein